MRRECRKRTLKRRTARTNKPWKFDRDEGCVWERTGRRSAVALMAEPVWPNVRMCGERGRVEEISLDASRLLRAFVHVNGGPGKFVRPAHSCAK